jgi:hypothetical protein
MNVAELDEVHYDLEVDGEQVREQLARRVWEASGWATVAITFRERDKAGDWKPRKVTVLRFRRMHEMWQRQAQITLGEDDARELVTWIGDALSAS